MPKVDKSLFGAFNGVAVAAREFHAEFCCAAPNIRAHDFRVDKQHFCVLLAAQRFPLGTEFVHQFGYHVLADFVEVTGIPGRLQRPIVLAGAEQKTIEIKARREIERNLIGPKTGAGAEEPEIMEAFLAQFYDDKDPPPLILLSHPVENPDLVDQLLSERAGRKVELAVPLRGEKAELLENAARNARESLARRMSESSTQNTLLRGLAEAFDLDAPPMRIEVYDNAHIQGSDAVGGMIVAGAEGFLKSQYRKFNIKSAAGANSDDFGMMREVMTRRFERLLKEDPDRKSDAWPDLLLIDGGAGQISAVAGILADLGVEDIAVVGVAKGIDRDAGKEEFHRTGLPVMALPRNDPVLYFIQRLRDEAHRWANGAHRAKRAKAVSITPLDDIPGVGAMRKRALLAHFGSAKAVSRAGVPDLMAVGGISQAMAEAIYNFFNP